MSNKHDIINPLQAIIAQAATLKDSKQVKKYFQRLNPYQINSCFLILIDISGSMAELVGSSRKIDLLRQALERPLHPDEIAIAFHSIGVRLHSLQDIPEPAGGTALHYALALAIPYKPHSTLVISDGKPDDPKQALCTAEKLSGTINTLYIGSDRDTLAIAFMRQLARNGCGRAATCDISNPQNQSLLKGKIQNLLKGS